MNYEYIAGLFDHKGNINHIRVKNREYLQLRIYSKSRAVLNKIKDFINCGNIYVKEFSKKNPKWKDNFELTLTSKDEIFTLLGKLLPFLVEKKEDAENLLIRHPSFESYDLNEKIKKEQVSYIG